MYANSLPKAQGFDSSLQLLADPYRFQRGRRVMLDLYGINHDPVLWPDPQTFSPARQSLKGPSAFDLVPQGGGDPFMGHRCAGEAVTIALLCDAVVFLVRRLDYVVPRQNLALAMKKLPALPAGVQMRE